MESLGASKEMGGAAVAGEGGHSLLAAGWLLVAVESGPALCLRLQPPVLFF
jgi:hypothetical protein